MERSYNQNTCSADMGRNNAGAIAQRVLLVEDYEPNVMVATFYLEMFGFDFDVARNGIEAVEKFKSQIYAAVLMDVQMPDLDGFDATQQIRQHEKNTNASRTTIIGMTAHALTGDRERCLASGMDDYITKPINLPILQNKLLNAVGRPEAAG